MACLEDFNRTYALRYIALGMLVGVMTAYYLMEWKRIRREREERQHDQGKSSCFMIPSGMNQICFYQKNILK